jgi:hypothetical protein
VGIERRQLDVLSVVCGVVGVRIGQVVCAKEAELGFDSSLTAASLESTQNSWVHLRCLLAVRGTRAATVSAQRPTASTGHAFGA